MRKTREIRSGADVCLGHSSLGGVLEKSQKESRKTFGIESTGLLVTKEKAV